MGINVHVGLCVCLLHFFFLLFYDLLVTRFKSLFEINTCLELVGSVIATLVGGGREKPPLNCCFQLKPRTLIGEIVQLHTCIQV